MSFTKYCLRIKATASLTLLISGTEDVALAISYNGSASRLALPIPNNFVVNP